MATVPCGRAQRIIAGGDGQFFVLGDVSYEEAGAWSVHFVPDLLFQGSVTIMARERGPGAAQDNVAFVPVPYRRVSLNNVAQDYQFVSDLITGNALLHIPAAGLTIAVLANCTVGSAVIYNHPLAGCATP